MKLRQKRTKKRKSTGLSKKPVNKAVLAAALTVVLCAAFTVMLGNYLSGKAEDAADNTTSPQIFASPDAAEAKEKSPPPVIQALFAGQKEDETPRAAAQRLYGEGARAVSALLFDEGRALYASEASTLFNSPQICDLTVLEICGAFTEKGIYVSALINSRALLLEGSRKTASDAYEALVFEEIAASGASEAVLFFGPISALSEDKAVAYFNMLKAIKPDFRIGIAIPYETISDERGASVVYNLYSAYDFVCIDFCGALPAFNAADDPGSAATAPDKGGNMTAPPETDTAYDSYLSEAQKAVCAAVKDALYYITIYNARVILPDLESKEEFYSLFKTESLTNYQFINR